MTYPGGKKHKVRDHGQRYEVSYFWVRTKERKVMGWCETMEGVRNMCCSIKAHPCMKEPEFNDRSKNGNNSKSLA